MNVNFKFKNGQEVVDKVSGFRGIIDCSAIWINGCIRYSIQPKMIEGKTEKPDSIWMDEQTLEFVSDGVIVKSEPTGGPSQKSDNCRM